MATTPSSTESVDTPRDWPKRESALVIKSTGFKVWEAVAIVVATALGIILNEFHSDRSLPFKVAVGVLLALGAIGGPYLAVRAAKRWIASREVLSQAKDRVHYSERALAVERASQYAERTRYEEERFRLQRLDELRGVVNRIKSDFRSIDRLIEKARQHGDKWEGHDWAWQPGTVVVLFNKDIGLLAEREEFVDLFNAVRDVYDKFFELQNIAHRHAAGGFPSPTMPPLPASIDMPHMLGELVKEVA